MFVPHCKGLYVPYGAPDLNLSAHWGRTRSGRNVFAVGAVLWFVVTGLIRCEFLSLLVATAMALRYLTDLSAIFCAGGGLGCGGWAGISSWLSVGDVAIFALVVVAVTVTFAGVA